MPHAPRFLIAAAALASLAVLVAPAAAVTLDSLLARLPADSLAVPLRRFENEASRPREGAQAAFLLGQLHYARGEYRRAAEAFSRAAARLDPARKSEARYWAALSWLALGDHAQARATFEELVSPEAPRRDDALFGTAVAWEQARRPERAYPILGPLSVTARGESAPAVLEYTMRFAHRFQQPGVAQKARERLIAEYPRSIEAARAGLVAATAAARAFAEVGPYPTEPQAHAVAERARAGGFPEAAAVTRGVAGAPLHFVRLGSYPSDATAKQAAERAQRDLHVPARVVSP